MYHVNGAATEHGTAATKVSAPAYVPIEEREVPRRWVYEWFGENRLPVGAGWAPPSERVEMVKAQNLGKLVAREVQRLEMYE